jgi:hypothetical protein
VAIGSSSITTGGEKFTGVGGIEDCLGVEAWACSRYRSLRSEAEQ